MLNIAGIVKADATSGNEAVAVARGYIDISSWGLTAGADYFADMDTDGAITRKPCAIFQYDPFFFVGRSWTTEIMHVDVTQGHRARSIAIGLSPNEDYEGQYAAGESDDWPNVMSTFSAQNSTSGYPIRLSEYYLHGIADYTYLKEHNISTTGQRKPMGCFALVGGDAFTKYTVGSSSDTTAAREGSTTWSVALITGAREDGYAGSSHGITYDGTYVYAVWKSTSGSNRGVHIRKMNATTGATVDTLDLVASGTPANDRAQSLAVFYDSDNDKLIVFGYTPSGATYEFGWRVSPNGASPMTEDASFTVPTAGYRWAPGADYVTVLGPDRIVYSVRVPQGSWNNSSGAGEHEETCVGFPLVSLEYFLA